MRVNSGRIALYGFLGAVLLALTAAPGYAQDEKRIHFNVGGGPTFIAGDLGNHFSTGWGPAVGVTLDAPNHRLGFQFEYAFRWFSISDTLPIGATRFSANPGWSATSNNPARAATCGVGTPDTGVGSSTPPCTRRRRPGRSVTSMSPPGRKTRLHGLTRPVATADTRILSVPVPVW